MYRLAPKYIEPGMRLGRDASDAYGNLVYPEGATLPKDAFQTLTKYGVREIIIDDPRTSDLFVYPLIPLQVLSEAAVALRNLFVQGRNAPNSLGTLLQLVQKPAKEMARQVQLAAIGEVNMSGCTTEDEYRHVRPVKVAEMAVWIGKKAGCGKSELEALAVAALLMDAGYLFLPGDTVEVWDPIAGGEESQAVRQHPELAARLLTQLGGLGSDIIDAITQHHERWDGSGYPRGLRGEATCTSARIIALADTYYNLVSDRPGHKAFMPHEAAEFVMAYSGAFFDPELVQIFSRQVPLYPTGFLVRLNTGEIAVVASSNEGHVARPVVRVIVKGENPVEIPYDLDLSVEEQQSRLIIEVFGY